MMNKAQWTIIAIGVILFAGLYFGFDTKPGKHKNIENQRQLAAVSTEINSLLPDAKASLSDENIAAVTAIEEKIAAEKADSTKVALLKRLSSLWYEFGKPAIAGHYAEKVAATEGSEDAWSIAGTTYSICLDREKEEKIRSFCAQKAIQALENAASLNPSNVQHKVNLASVYAANPPSDNPMKGVLMMVELNKQFPENPVILTQLGRMAIETGQFQKAIERLGQVLAIESENPKAVCLMVQAYEGLGDETKAADFRSKCDKLLNR
jgi:tetratricopeptide (TPR) repeat protein